MLKKAKLFGIIFVLLIIFSGSTTGVLRTIDSVSIDISDNSATAGESIDIEGTVTGTGITAIRISHREDGGSLADS